MTSLTYGSRKDTLRLAFPTFRSKTSQLSTGNEAVGTKTSVTPVCRAKVGARRMSFLVKETGFQT